MNKINDKNYTFDYNLEYDNYIYDDDSDCGIILYEEMREWLEENNIRYKLMWIDNEESIDAHIRLFSKSTATAFKLKWF